MPYKPQPRKEYESYIKLLGWTLVKGGIDYNLYDENGDFLCSIKIAHGANTKGNEVVAHSVKKTENLAKERGFQWPPQKKRSNKS